MEKSKRDALVKRILSSLLIVPLTLLAIYLGMPYFNLFVLFLGCLLIWEWTQMLPTSKKNLFASIYAFALGASVWLLHIFAVPLAIVLASALAVSKSKGEKHRAFLILGAPYISIGLGAFAWLYSIGGLECVLWFVLTVWSVDIGGYVVGTSVKGPKLAPKISPNKTWSGLLGGMLLATLVTWAYVFAFDIQPYWQTALIAAAPVVAVIAQIGDLIESYMKRTLNLKDSSNLIPGHGGIFDRIDGLVFAAPFVLIFVILLFNFQMS